MLHSLAPERPAPHAEAPTILHPRRQRLQAIVTDAPAELPSPLEIDRLDPAPVYRLRLTGPAREAPRWSEIAAALTGEPGELVVAFARRAEDSIEETVRELSHAGLCFLELRQGEGGFEAVFRPARSDDDEVLAELILERERDGRRWTIDQRTALEIGRAEDCAIRLDSPRVSARHCALRFVRRAVSVVDLHSEAGTYIDNRRIHQAVIDEYALLCLGSKETGDYLEAELRIPIGAAAFLHIISGSHAGRSVPIVRGRGIIGRSPACDLQIIAPYISRAHARISLLESIVLIEDLQSANGTWLNGRSITGARLLPGDRLDLAGEAFRALAREDAPPPPGWTIAIAGRRAALDAPTMTLGRDPSCELRFDLEGLSRFHARLAWESGRLRLYELAGIAATSVDGRTAPDGFLERGSLLHLGPHRARIDGPEAP